MLYKAIIASVLISGVCAVPSTPAQQFELFKKNFNKIYDSKEEEAHRFMVFKENLKLIEERNARDTAQHGVTKFADLTPLEFDRQFTNYRPAEKDGKREATKFHKFNIDEQAKPKDGTGLVDWTNVYTTAVKNQGKEISN
jgi:hypothetical protein